MKRRVFAFVMALAMMTLLLAGCQSSGNIAAESRSGVVRVLSVYSDCTIYYLDYESGDVGIYAEGETLTATGSSFGVGSIGKETDIFVTNRHVVADLDKEILGFVTNSVALVASGKLSNVYLLMDDYAYSDTTGLDTSRAIPCEILYRADNNKPDLAVLQAANKVPGRKALPLLAEGYSIESGETVHALGYPSLTEGYVTDTLGNKTYYASVEQVTVTVGNVSLHSTMQDGDARVNIIQHTAQINSGNSGGPLIDNNGAVVAVNTWGWSDGSQSNFGSIEISYVRDILDGLHIRYGVYPSGPSWMIIGGVSLGVLVLGAIVVLAVLRKKRGRPEPKPEPGPEPTIPAFNPAQEYRIQGVNGVFAGRRFAINEGVPVRIGTDPSANDLVFPAGTSGVSRRHCVLTLRNGQLWLQDVGSTYGTMAGTQRLTKDQPVALGMGGQFSLGSDQQTFVITGKGGV